jgi:integrase
MYTNVLNWLDFYKTYLLRRPLQPDDFIFPAIGENGTSVHPNRPMTADIVQKMITKMATNTGIDGAEHFTTHCFRRGGVQYRFMFAPVGQRWTLARIRWWGGWAQGEHVSYCNIIYYMICNLEIINFTVILA